MTETGPVAWKNFTCFVDVESAWLKGFFVSTVGIDEQTIQNYVRWQGQEEAGQAELDL